MTAVHSRNFTYTQGDSDAISFHIYASWFSPGGGRRHLVGKTLRNICNLNTLYR